MTSTFLKDFSVQNELICTLWFQAAEVALSLDSVCYIILFQNIKGGKQNHK